MRSLTRDLSGLLLVLALLLTGCGDDAGEDVAEDPAPTKSTQPVEPALLTLWSRSDAGGAVDPLVQPLDSEAAVAEFAAQFPDGAVATALQDEVAALDVPEGQVAAGAVVAIGCDPPTDATVEVTDRGVEVTSPPVKSDKQCLVAVTTIAIVAADPDQV